MAPWCHLQALPTLPQGPVRGHLRGGPFREPGLRQSLPSQVRLGCKVCRWEPEAKVKAVREMTPPPPNLRLPTSKVLLPAG